MQGEFITRPVEAFLLFVLLFVCSIMLDSHYRIVKVKIVCQPEDDVVVSLFGEQARFVIILVRIDILTLFFVLKPSCINDSSDDQNIYWIGKNDS